MIDLPSGRKVEIIFRKYSSGTHAVHIDLADGDTDRVARINKPWTTVGDRRMWLNAEINFNWPQLTCADMADYQEIVRIAFEQAKLLDEDFVPGRNVK